MKKRFLSILLALALCLSLLPTAALADVQTVPDVLYVDIKDVVDTSKTVSGVYLSVYKGNSFALSSGAMTSVSGTVYKYDLASGDYSGCDDLSVKVSYRDYDTSYAYYAKFSNNTAGGDLCILGASADAGTWSVYSVASIEGKGSYPTFAAALEAAVDGDTIKLLRDVTETKTPIEKSITLDLNGHNLTHLYESGNTCYIAVQSSNVTITDTSSGEKGAISGLIVGDSDDSPDPAKAANVTLDGGVRLTTNSASVYANSTLTVKNAVIEKNIEARGGTLYVTGGTVNLLAVYASCVKVELSGGTFKSIGRYHYDSEAAYPMTFPAMLKAGHAYQTESNTKLQLSDISDYDREDTTFLIARIDKVTVVRCASTGTGCGYDTTEATGLCLYCATPHSSHDYDKTNPTGKCTDCGVPCDHTGYEDDEFCTTCGLRLKSVQLTHTEDGTDTTTLYTSFNDAYNAAKDGDTITLLADAVYRWPDRTSSSHLKKSLTIDLDGNTLSALYPGESVGVLPFEYGTVTVKNGTVSGMRVLSGNMTLADCTVTSLSLDGCTLNVTGTVTVGTLRVLADENFTCDLTCGTFGAIQFQSSTYGLEHLLKNGYGFRSTGDETEWYTNGRKNVTEKVVVTPLPIKNVNVIVTGSKELTYGYTETDERPTVSCEATYLDDAKAGAAKIQWFVKELSEDEFENYGDEIDTTFSFPTGQEAGKHTVKCVVTVDGYSREALSETITVKKATLTTDDYTAPEGTGTLTYDATEQSLVKNDTGEFNIDFAEGNEQPKFKYSVNGGDWDYYARAEDADAYTVQWYIDGGRNYTSVGSETDPAGSFDVTIDRLSVNPAIVFDDETAQYTYTGSEIQPSFKLMADGTEIPEDEYTVSYHDNTNACNYATVTVTCATGGNYKFDEVTKTFEIKKATVPTEPGTGSLSVYNGQTREYTFDFSTLLPKLESGRSYGDISYAVETINMSSDDGKYLCIIEGEGPPSVGADGKLTLKINAENGTLNDATVGTVTVKVSSTNYADFYLTLNLVASNKEEKDLKVTMADYTYGDDPSSPSYTMPEGATNLTVKYKGRGETTYEESTTAPTDAGEYTVSVYYETDTQIWRGAEKFTILQKDITGATITLGDTLTYSGSSQTQQITSVTLGGEPVTYTVSGDTGTNAGDYTLTVTGTGNYTSTATKDWSIGKAKLTASVTAEGKPYDGTDAATITGVEFTGLVNSETLTRDTDYTVTASFPSKNVGDNRVVTATITLKDSDKAKNYVLESATATATSVNIEQKDVYAVVTVADKTYDGTTTATVTAEITTGLIDGDSITITGLTGTFDDPNAGTGKTVTINSTNAVLSGADAGNYNVMYPAKITTGRIVPAPATVTTAPTANSLTYTGSAQELVTAGEAGNGQMQYRLGEDGEWSTEIPTATDADTYTVWYKAASTDESGNYCDSEPVSLSVTIEERAATIPGGGTHTPSYSVTVPGACANGSVTVSTKSARKGATVTITVTPDKGYVLESLTVTDRNGNALALTDNGDGTWSFKMPASGVTILAAFMEDNSMLNFFVDVTADKYYYDAVLWAAENGITGGVDTTHFGPDESCTRAQIVTFLWRAAGCPEPKSAGGFADVSANSYYARAVAWAVETGITGGIGNDLFAPNDSCTRAQAVTFLFRFAAANGMDFVTLQELVSSYGDVSGVPDYAIPAFNWALANGVVKGANGLLMPDDECSRAQIMTMLYRLIGQISEYLA